MKSLKILLFAAVATILAACTKDDGTSVLTYDQVKAMEDQPVSFDTFIGGTPYTRSGYVGHVADVDALQDQHFGVFGYYTRNTTSDATYLYPGTEGTSAGSVDINAKAAEVEPNFMWNQEVSHDGTNWTYSPVKYWPNDFNGDGGAVDKQTVAAKGTINSRLSFFAYAPYVATPSGTSGITAISPNNVSGNPKITYTIDPNGQNVDLLWGALNGTTVDVLGADNAGGYVVDHSKNILKYLDTDTADEPKVNINLKKQKTGTTSHVGFKFYHTLAQLGGKANGGLQIQTDEDVVGNIGAETRVTVAKIEIKNQDASMYNSGTFDLATGTWTPTDVATSSLAFTHTIDNQEANNAETNTWRLSSEIIEPKTDGYWTGKSVNGSWVLGVPTGVTSSPIDVYHSTAEPSPIVFIPDTTPKLTITVEYYVRTADKNLNGGYSEVKQVITKNVNFTASVQANKHYKLLLKLGMTTVKVSATVETWTGVTAGSIPASVDLPLNVN